MSRDHLVMSSSGPKALEGIQALVKSLRNDGISKIRILVSDDGQQVIAARELADLLGIDPPQIHSEFVFRPHMTDADWNAMHGTLGKQLPNGGACILIAGPHVITPLRYDFLEEDEAERPLHQGEVVHLAYDPEADIWQEVVVENH